MSNPNKKEGARNEGKSLVRSYVKRVVSSEMRPFYAVSTQRKDKKLAATEKAVVNSI